MNMDDNNNVSLEDAISTEEGFMKFWNRRKDLQKLKLEESRKTGVSKITMDSVLNWLTFVSENSNMLQDELFDKLLEMGCNYTYNDLLEQFPDFENKDVMSNKDVEDGAYLALRVRDEERVRLDPFIKKDILDFMKNASNNLQEENTEHMVK